MTYDWSFEQTTDTTTIAFRRPLTPTHPLDHRIAYFHVSQKFHRKYGCRNMGAPHFWGFMKLPLLSLGFMPSGAPHFWGFMKTPTPATGIYGLLN